MRVAIRGLIVASAGAAVTAIYVFLVAPHLLDPDNMVAPLLFVRLPLFFVHALLLAMLCGSLVCASRAFHDRGVRTPAGYSVFAISLAATAALAYRCLPSCLRSLRDCHANHLTNR